MVKMWIGFAIYLHKVIVSFFHGGERFVAVDPEVIESATAYELLPEERRKLFERFKLEKFLRMHLAECGVDTGNVSFNCSSSKID